MRAAWWFDFDTAGARSLFSPQRSKRLTDVMTFLLALSGVVLFVGQHESIDRILDGIKPEVPRSYQVAEDALVKLGSGSLPLLRSALATRKTGAKEVVGAAILRLTWGSNPSKALDQWFSKAGGAPGASQSLIADLVLFDIAPNCAFYSVHFREWPSAAIPPKPYAQRNVLMVQKSGKVELFTDPKKLATAFAMEVGSVPRNQVVQITEAWLQLSQVFSQDGYFRFSIPRDKIKLSTSKGGIVSTGKATVDPTGGDTGEIVATLSFVPNRNRELDLRSITEKRTVKPGVRPICQATKLLDPDPIVRRMAERDLLVMGVKAKSYLDEQLALADEKLRAAIESIWKRILRGER